MSKPSRSPWEYDSNSKSFTFHTPLYPFKSDDERKKEKEQASRARKNAEKEIKRRKNQGTSGGHGF